MCNPVCKKECIMKVNPAINATEQHPPLVIDPAEVWALAQSLKLHEGTATDVATTVLTYADQDIEDEEGLS